MTERLKQKKSECNGEWCCEGLAEHRRDFPEWLAGEVCKYEILFKTNDDPSIEKMLKLKLGKVRWISKCSNGELTRRWSFEPNPPLKYAINALSGL